MSGTIEHLAFLANSAREDFAQDWHDAEETGERPDLEPITVEMSVEFAESVIDEIAALQARVAELEAALVEDDEEQAKWIGELTDDWIAAEAHAEAAKALLSEAVKAVEQEMLRVCNEYSKKGNMAAVTAIHDTWLCVQTALAAIQEAKP